MPCRCPTSLTIVIVAAAMSLLAAGCGGSSSTTAATTTTSGALAYARCMRSHGVANFPDPTTDPQGQPFFDVSAHGISDGMAHSPSFTAKLNECQRQVGNFPYSFG